MQTRLGRIATETPPVCVSFPNVTRGAQAFVGSVLLQSRPKQRVWFVCPGVRDQEEFFNGLGLFAEGALFFPAMEISAAEGAVPDPEISAERLTALGSLAMDPTEGGARAIVVCAGSLDDRIPDPQRLRDAGLCLAKGGTLDLGVLAVRMSAAGYERVPQVNTRGQFAVRGGLIDLFSWQHAAPVRVELFDDTIESIREFDLDRQTSTRSLESVTVLREDPDEETRSLRDCIGPDDLMVAVDAEIPGAHAWIGEGPPPEDIGAEDWSGAFFESGFGDFEAGDLIVAEGKRGRFFRQIGQWIADKWRVVIFCHNEGERERLRDLFAETSADTDTILFLEGGLSRGFTFPDGRLAVLSDAELFGRYRSPSARRIAERRARMATGRSQINFSELVEGDYVVHLEHGIGRFLRIRDLPSQGASQEVLEIEFADDSRLYVPVEHAYLVSRYVGVGKRNPALNTLGDGRWSRAKERAEKAVFDYAARMLAIHAERDTSQGHAFKEDTRWQHEFESAFVHTETPDQLCAITDTKTDMESRRPMDRLICGDVGFGKTEVAIRAAFKAVMEGKQVALLAPTTVLAQQHYHTFRERMSDYPITTGMLSRFRTPREQRETVAGLADGTVDIVVGTHRLISDDIRFKDLGLVVIDEEQRFGVLHKERFKEKFKLVDVLTLSATPIPRTLYLSLMGARDMSVIETPPANRLPVETVICGYDERVIRDAIRRELARQGQVYFLHNRVQTIEHMRERVALLCPEARIDIGHGQMEEEDLEEVMDRFVRGETDVLLSTTIIESGLDIPNANTILIDRADRFGLADLYQLRGRVGRAQHKAYAYFLMPRDLFAAGAARKRIHAIKQYSDLGAGFKIAMRDLEIRGAGNILGTAQSGHIVQIGFDLYCQLLRQAVARLKGGRPLARADTPVDLDFVSTTEADHRHSGGTKAPAFVPSAWLPEASRRIAAAREAATLVTLEELEILKTAWRDRFGPPPAAVENLLVLAGIRILASEKKVSRVEARDGRLILTRGGDFVLLGGKFPRLTAPTPDLTVRQVFDLLRSL